MKVRCPTCGKPAAWKNNEYRPFCGERCHVVDLGNWADESYRIAGDTVSPENFEDDPEAGDLAGTKRIN